LSEPDEETLKRLQLEAALGDGAVYFYYHPERWVTVWSSGTRKWYHKAAPPRRWDLWRENGPATELSTGELIHWFRDGKEHCGFGGPDARAGCTECQALWRSRGARI
jgi:hypothetical protein